MQRVCGRQYGRDPRVIGSSVIVGASSYTVVGVAPRDFTALQRNPADLWIPMDEAAGGYLFSEWRTNRGSFWLQVAGRLPRGTNAGQASARVGALLGANPEKTEVWPTGIITSPLIASRGDDQSREVKVSLWLAAVASVVLLIACANITNLTIARNIARGREYAVRLSLGASHWQLRRHLLADIVAVAIPGMMAALYVDFVVRRAMRAFLEADVPLPADALDARMLAFIGIGGAITLLFVAGVSLSQVRPGSLATTLMARTLDTRRGGQWVRHALLVLQSALCVALLFSAGLFAKSLSRVLALDLGVDMDRTVQVSIRVPRGQRTPAELRVLYDQALARMEALPGVERASLATAYPFNAGSGIGPFTAEHTQEELWANAGSVGYSSSVGPGFFEAIGSESFVGRDFSTSDRADAPKVVILNANMARKLYPQGNALGQCIFLYESRECYRVIGIMGGTWKLRALERDQMAVYLPLAQTNETPGSLLIRTRGDPRPILSQLRVAVQSVASDLPAVNVSRASDLVAAEFRPWRLGASLFGGFAFVALLIAAVGLYGVVAFTMTLRVREIGVRTALGARAVHIMRTVAGSGMGAVILGLAIGSAGSLLASRFMGDVLYETSPRDPLVLAQTALVLLAVAGIAVVRPIVRALRLPPSDALRTE